MYSYGVALAVSLGLAWVWMQRWARRENRPETEVGLAFVAAALAGLIGARLLYVAVNPDEVRGVRDVFAFSRGGLALYGAWWGGWFGSWWQLRKTPTTLWRFGDAAAPAIAGGLALTRVGCYLYGSDFGRVLPDGAPAWLARLGTFPRWSGAVSPPGGAGSPAWLEHVRGHGLPATAAASFPVHPTQLYEVALALGLVALAWRIRPRFAGERLLVLAFVDAAARFGLETLRDDPDRGVVWLGTSPRWGLTLGAVVLAAAWVVGTSRILPLRWRRPSWVLAAMIPVAVTAALAGLPETETTWLVSTSQLLGLATAVGVAAVVRRRAAMPAQDDIAPVEDATETTEEAEPEEPEAAPEADIADPFVAEPKPRKKRRKRRKKKA